MTDAKRPGEPPAPLEERYADVKAVRIRYFVGGSGQPLILVHGLTGAASNWVDLVPRLSERFRLLVPDLPGHGGSAPLPAAPSLDAYAERVFLLAQREGLLPAAVVGHSLGGVVALRVALRHPEAVRAVVLAGSAGIASATRWAEFWISVLALSRPGRLAAPVRDVVARSSLLRRIVFTRWMVADPLAPSGSAVEGLLAGPGLHTDVAAAGQALVRDDPRLDLERVRCPALVVWGARDYQVPVEDAFEYARRLGAPLRVIADCGHLLIAERPDACFDAITAFVDSLPPPPVSRP